MALSGWGVFLVILILLVVGGGGGYTLYTHYRARRLGLPPPSLNPFSQRRRGETGGSTYRAPAPAPGGIQGWLSNKWHSLRNQRTAGGAYESTGYGGGEGERGGGSGTTNRDRRGFGPLDPDEAWSAHVDNEAGGYYEEQELGLQDPAQGPYGGRGYGGGGGDIGVGVGGIEEGRGRSRSRQRELDSRYEEEVHGGGSRQQGGGDSGKLNPFGDQAALAPSLRGVSPRPHVDTSGAARAVSAHRKNNSSLGTTGSADNSPTERRSMFREDV
ncbi:hypothetical protein B0A55_06803 [Friedmanniomyces simplex]|uniref:Uncharacterized protein n=1 Tax=Friedmanniomyces simplex TaxID=329884 RepID=A0A4U0X8D9_9PEZI|nr:hypothetical protein B0A55_06803 [Friedmanniomyces simplex]